tara:strand:- start:3014 stop:4435 length:1422 start_codon:yes stop_codon:yes gene_type:complete
MKFAQYLIKNIKILIILMLIALSILYIFRKHIPDNITYFIRQYVFVYQNISNLKLEIKRLDKSIKNLESKINKKNSVIFDLSASKSKYFFVKNEKEKELIFDNKKVKILKFSNEEISNLTPRAHFEFHDNKVFLITGVGQILYSSLDSNNFYSNKLEFSQIKTNLFNKIGTDYLSETGSVIKSILIIDKLIFVSYVKKHNEECYTNAILKAEFNYKKINFEDFFDTNDCSVYYGHQTGGIFAHYKKNQFVYSVGDWYAYTLEDGLRNDKPQQMESLKGKILKFTIDNNKPEIISLGHRNPQGLRYDKNNNILFSTDHGPQGGDEINIDESPETKPIKNYGWGIASYGEHYGYPKNDPEEYILAPLYKSHKKYGFIEPLTYFVPSIAITQIDFVDDKSSNNRNFFVGALGYDLEEGDKSIHYITFNKNNYWEKKTHNIIPIDERIRDLKYYNDIGLLFWAEESGSIGILKFEND